MATARGMFDAAKHPRGSHGRFGSGGAGRATPTWLIIDYHDNPLVHTLAATRAWIKAGRPKTRTVSRVRAATASAAWEHEFGTPMSRAKFKPRRSRSLLSKR